MNKSTAVDSKEPKVSISIICYNQENYIEEAVKSAVDQNYGNLQVVVSDDCSVDGTVGVLEKLERSYDESRLKVIYNKKNQGITKNSNTALLGCDGDFVAFQGGDDVLYQNKIRLQVAWFQRNSAAVLCGHQLNMVEEESLVSCNHKKMMRKGKGAVSVVRRGHPFGATSIMIRSTSIPAGGFDETIPNISDGLFWVETLLPGGEFGFIEGTYGLYRKHADNFTNNKIEAIWQLDQYYDHISSKYPQLEKSCRIGKSAVLHYGLGLVYSNRKDYKNSWKYYIRAFAGDPFNPKTIYQMGQNIAKQIGVL